MPDITMSTEQLDLTVAILATGPAVAGSRVLASKFEQAWIAQAGEGGQSTPVSCSDEECQMAKMVLEASHEPGADALAAIFDSALNPEPPPTGTTGEGNDVMDSIRDPDLDPR